jgi:hypothetical protein
MTCTYCTCSWMMLTTLYENFTYTLPNKVNHVHLPCIQAYSLYAFSSDAPFCMSTYAPASYMIVNRESGRRTRGTGRAARGAAIGGARSRRGGR